MESVTVSSKYRGVIPERIRRTNHIRPGDKMAVIVKHGVVHLIPVRPLRASKDMFKGLELDLTDLRDHSEGA